MPSAAQSGQAASIPIKSNHHPAEFIFRELAADHSMVPIGCAFRAFRSITLEPHFSAISRLITVEGVHFQVRGEIAHRPARLPSQHMNGPTQTAANSKGRGAENRLRFRALIYTLGVATMKPCRRIVAQRKRWRLYRKQAEIGKDFIPSTGCSSGLR
ncbi:MAG: hypothetical protein DMF61_21610 [Blastocatellia bacterium AA13]|nr:MAG: hypothetical protein DMF61_21610 [Blastocatellia bacterium AA13]